MGNLFHLKQLPTNKDVVLRRRQLQNENFRKSKTVFFTQLVKDIEFTWLKQDISVQKWKVIYIKLQHRNVSENNMLFDCLPNNLVWETTEDKLYYNNQKLYLDGNCSSKQGCYRIHPAKRSRNSLLCKTTVQPEVKLRNL